MSRTFASPARYVQGAGMLDEIGRLTMQYGDSALLIADDEVWDIVGNRIEASFDEVDGTYQHNVFRGKCTTDEIDRLTAIANKSDAEIVLGIGGGKAIDTAKSVCARTGLTLGSVPTVASTDAPTSSLSIVYGTDGAWEAAEQHRFHPEFVLVDSRTIAQAPTRWFVSGIGDALATWYEAKTTWESGGTTVFDDRPTYAGKALAETCYRLLRDHAEGAVGAVEANVVTESVEAVIEAIILLSGLGFENGGLAAAHAVHDGLTSLPDAAEATHGEKVMVGLLTQMMLEGASDQSILELVSFGRTVGLPVSLTDIGVTSPTREDLLQVGHVACDTAGPMGNEVGEVTPERVADALVAVDSFVK
jgi:glycerol dehydrogenase